MAGRKFSIEEYFNTRCAEIQPLYSFDATNEKQARTWRGRALAKIRDLLGEMPDPVQLCAEVVDAADMGTYVREKVIFDSDTHSSVPGYILVPKGIDTPMPTVLCLHGHGPGKGAVAGVDEADGSCTRAKMREAIKKYNYDYARKFAERGYVTFTFDFRCFGERNPGVDMCSGRDPCNVHFIRGALLGINLLTLNIHDAIRALDYLETRPEVDPKRIGCVGLSFGGTMTMWTTLLDKRIKAAVVSGYLCEFESFAIRMGNFCGSQFVPTLRRYFDMCDIMSLIAPRPLLVQSGISDQGFPVESARKAFGRLKKTYEVWNAADRIKHDLFEGGHQFHDDTAFKWIDEWLPHE